MSYTRNTTRREDFGFRRLNVLNTTDPLPPATDFPDVLTTGGSVAFGNNVPSYRRVIAAGGNATTDMGGSFTNVEYSPGVILQEYEVLATGAKYHHSRSGNLCDAALPNGSQPATAAADDMAAAAFYSNATEAQSAMQAGTFIAELSQAARMVLRPAKALRKGFDDYLRDLKKRKRGSSKQRAKALADTYLEHQFGWGPLVSDIDNGMRALARAKIRSTNTEFVTGFGFSEGLLLSSSSGAQVQNLRWTQTFTRKTSAIVKYYGRVKVSAGGNAGAYTSNFGLTLNQFVPTVWNLIPYSFVVDYFTNIGDILTAATFANSDLVWVSKSTVQDLIETRNGINPEWVSIPPTQRETQRKFVSSSFTATRRIVNRYRSVSVPVPSLRFQVPGIGSMKWLNLAALATSARRLTPY